MQEKIKKKYDRRPKFRIVLLSNNEYKCTMFRYKTKKKCFEKYRELIKNNLVVFPKKFINYGEIKPVTYKLCITREKNNSDINDSDEIVFLGDWVILKQDGYNIEEDFWVFGYEKVRPKIFDIIKILYKDINTGILKRVCVIHNKLIIDSEEEFDMVICKCVDDAKRLHNTLYNINKKKTHKNIVFMGHISNHLTSYFYDLIEENTGWGRQKIKRTTTRP